MQMTEYPDNIIGVLFRLLQAAVNIANGFVENLMRTPSEIINEWLSKEGIPTWLSDVLTTVIELSNPIFGLTSNLSIFDLLLGSAFIIVLVIGFVKFFGDAVGL